MRIRLTTLALLLPAYLSAAYTYYYTDNLQSASHSAATFYENGASSNGTSGFVASTAGGGSYIAKSGPPDGSHQYEVAATVNAATSGGNYVLYLEATPNALLGSTSTGSFYAIAISDVSISSGSCTALASLYKVVNGSVSLLEEIRVPCGASVTYHAAMGADNQIHFYVNRVEYIVWQDTGTLLVGNPGIGGYSMPSGNSISFAELGPCDRTPPGGIDPKSVETFLHTGEVDIETAGAQDDANGTGVAEYLLWRDGNLIGTANTPEFSDTGASAGSHTYTIRAYDFHGSLYPVGVDFTVEVPSNPTFDPFEPGIRPTGSYWGAKGENIDLRSGNLNFTYPLVKAISRRWAIPLTLVYNSQNWRLDTTGNPWRLGQSVGFGFGWTIQIGSLTAFYSELMTVKFYQFSDASGAIYRLDQRQQRRLDIQREHLRHLRFQPAAARVQQRLALDYGLHFRRTRAGRRDHVPDAA